MAKVDKESRGKLESAIELLEENGWKVTRYHVDGDAGVMRVDMDMVHYADDSDMRIRTTNGGVDLD